MASNLTDNLNYLSPLGFKLIINNQLFANTQYFCTSATLPGLSLPEVPVPFRGSQNFAPGDRIDYPNFDIRFIVDEDMNNYIEMHNWIRRLQSNNNQEWYDATLCILNSHQNVARKIRFAHAYPTMIGLFEMNVQNTDVDYIAVDVSFRYTYFEFVP